MTYEKALTALADPTRRAIIDRLRHGPEAVGELANDLPISRPAVSQHLRVLSDAGLVAVAASGTRRLYRLAPEGWNDLRAYLDTMWDLALLSYAKETERISKE